MLPSAVPALNAELDRVQQQAAGAAVGALRSAKRTQVIMPCGTGKTRVGALVADALNAGTCVVFVPSLSIAAQTVRHWQAHDPSLAVLAICSDETVVDRDADPGRVEQVARHAQVLSDPLQIACWLADHPGRALVVCTYHSSAKLAAAQARHRARRLDLGIFDEAHRCASGTQSAFTLALDDRQIGLDRRVFLTATPRMTVASGRNGTREIDVVSLDDAAMFGQVAYELTFGQAVALGLLTDYQVVVAVTDRADLARLMSDADSVRLASGSTDSSSAVCALALLDAVQRFGLRRLISFHNSIEAAALFATDVAELGDLTGRPLDAAHVNGMMDEDLRERLIAPLRDDELAGRPYLVTNARLLGEGVDLPALDAVAFAQPRSSKLEIIQAIGRAMRLHPAKGVATIVLPVVLSADGELDPLADRDAWEPCWAALRALRDHDVRIVRSLTAGHSAERPAAGPPVTVVGGRLLPAGFEQAFTSEVVMQTTTDWERRADELERFCAEHGRVPSSASAEDSDERQIWLFYVRQRALRARGSLSVRQIARLDAIANFAWYARDQHAAQMIAQLQAFVAQHGRLPRRVGGLVEAEQSLGSFVHSQREAMKAGSIDADRARELEAVPGWTWSTPTQLVWEARAQELSAWVAEHGRLPLASEVGTWMSKARAAYRAGRLTDEQIAALEQVPGWDWDPKRAEWMSRLADVQRWAAEHGGLPTRRSNERLAMWLRTNRNAFRAGRLDDEQAGLLEQLPGFRWDLAI